MNSLLEELNEEQINPVLDAEGAVLVTAGAGSGKTLYLGPLGGGDSGFLPGHGLCGGGGVPACPCGAGAL